MAVAYCALPEPEPCCLPLVPEPDDPEPLPDVPGVLPDMPGAPEPCVTDPVASIIIKTVSPFWVRARTR